MKDKLLDKRLARYITAGVLAYILELGVLLALYKLAGLSTELATAIAFWVGLVSSFLLQKLFAFQDYQKTVSAISRQLVSYGLLVVFNYIFTLLVVAVFPSRLIVFSRTLALVVTTIWNYTLYQRIFQRKLTGLSFKQRFIQIVKLNNRYFNIMLLILPILLFSLRFLATGNKVLPGDPDYYMQLYDAFRRTVLEFHQFPWLDPWISGGIPLFANIQFGLVSLQAPLVLIFGPVFGWKLAVVAYQLVAFFGFRRLFRRNFGAPAITASLLAYLPVFGGYFTYRTIAGHFTFLLVAFFPWLLSFWLERTTRRNWLRFGLVLSFMIWSTPQHATLMAIVVLAIWIIYELIFKYLSLFEVKGNSWQTFWQTEFKPSLIFLLKSGALISALTAYRLFFAYSFVKDFPRPEPANEPYTGVLRGLYAIWGPNQYHRPPHLPSGWGWVEASAYIGLGSLIALGLIGLATIMFYRRKRSAKVSLFSYPLPLLVLLFLTIFILGMGSFGAYSPYSVLHHLPIFNNTRVSTRWLEWASLIALIIIAAYKGSRFRLAINLALLAAVIELFLTSSAVLGRAYFVNLEHYRSPKAAFNQEMNYRLPRPQYKQDSAFQNLYFYDRNLLETTENNLGQVIADDSLVDTRQPGSTVRCGANQANCNFVSPNGQLIYWSPNKLVLKRLASGPINLNMNPGKGWRVNGRYIYASYKIVDPRSAFIITDPSSKITLQYAPKFSPEWLAGKL